MNIYTIIIICVGCIFYKIFVNLCCWWRLKKYKDLYITYSSNIADKKNDEQNGWKIIENKAEIIKLFERAGLKSFLITITQPTGYGFANHNYLDLFQNLASLTQIGNVNIPSTIMNYFYEGIGVYKARIKEALSIIFWLNTLIFLPQKIIAYLDFSIKAESIKLISKIFNFIYWIIIVIFTIILPMFHWSLALIQID